MSLILPKGPFSTIVADPAWSFDNKKSNGAADNHYSTMSIEEIARLPVAEVAADNAQLYLWVTDAHAPDALQYVMRMWGFRFVQFLHWIKMKEGKLQMGAGNYFRHCSETVLFGVRGRAVPAVHNRLAVFFAERTKHSKKPQEFFDLIEPCLLPGPRLEMFAREGRPGWEVWGNEVESLRQLKAEAYALDADALEEQDRQANMTPAQKAAERAMIEEHDAQVRAEVVTFEKPEAPKPPPLPEEKPRRRFGGPKVEITVVEAKAAGSTEKGLDPRASVVEPQIDPKGQEGKMEIPDTVSCKRCAIDHDVHADRCPRCQLKPGYWTPGMKAWEPPVEGFQYAIAVEPGSAYVLPDARLAYADGTSETPSGNGFAFFKLPGANVNDRVRLDGSESVLPADPATAVECPDCKQTIAGETITEETTACPYCTIIATRGEAA